MHHLQLNLVTFSRVVLQPAELEKNAGERQLLEITEQNQLHSQLRRIILTRPPQLNCVWKQELLIRDKGAASAIT